MPEKRVPFKELSSTKLTQTYHRVARSVDRDPGRDEFEIEDDPDTQQRIIKFKPKRTHIVMGGS